MKNEKYRSLMVTPAFLEARKRKERNETTHGRVLPPSSALGRTTARPTNSSLETKPHSSPPRLKFSKPQDAWEKAEVASDSILIRERSSHGEHLKSWTIPERLTSTDCIKVSEDLPCQPDPNITGDTDETEIRQRPKPNQSSRSHDSKKQSLLPTISSENRRGSSKSSSKEVKSLDFGKEWLRKFDKEERRVLEGILKRPSDERNESNPFKQTIQLRNTQKSRALSLPMGKSNKPSIPATPSYPNILHKTSSVAWRRDSTWLKPERTSYQSWHGLPMHQFNNDIANITAMYMLPHKKTCSTFTIHPEWGCKV